MKVGASQVLCCWCVCLACHGAYAEEHELPVTGGAVTHDAAEQVEPFPLPEAPAEAEPKIVALESMEHRIDQGLASWYGRRFHGRPTASGEPFDMHALTAAHPTLPFGTVVRVRSLDDGRSVDVRINDRGPWIKRRVIDLSRAAAEALGVIALGTRRVVLSVLSPGDKKDKSSSPGR